MFRQASGHISRWGSAVTLGAALVAALAVGSPAAVARETPVALAELPEAARQTHQRIVQGGPFPYAKDGSVFGNRERLLPARARGHYREYTVPTPGAADRGARRIVCGGERAAEPESCFYTADHYASFRLIAR